MTDVRFKIRDNNTGLLVQIISALGDVVGSTIGSSYGTYGEAIQYVYDAQKFCNNAGFYIDISRFIIEEYRLIPYQSINIVGHKDEMILSDSDHEDIIKYVKTILKTCVNDGFMSIPARYRDFILTYDKYQPILSELVPPHMLQSIDEFMVCGIKGCDLDALGSISLTATENQLKMYDIDNLIIRRENKISK